MKVIKSSAFEYYKLAIEARNLELRLFWQRSLFFAGFIAAIFIAFYTLEKTTSGSAQESTDFFKSLLLILGGFFSLAWSLGNRGSKFWYESWESKIDECEKTLKIDFFHHWIDAQPKFWLYRARLYSVSKIAIFLSDLTFIAWVFLLSQHLDLTSLISLYDQRLTISLAGVVILVLLLLLFLGTRTDVPADVVTRWRQKKSHYGGVRQR